MKILVVTPTFLPLIGGAEVGIFEIFQRLALKHDIKILTPLLNQKHLQDFGAVDEYFFPRNLYVARFNDRINLQNWPGQRVLKGILPPFSFSTIWALSREIKIFKPDVINVFYAIPTGLAGWFAQKVKGIPVVLSLIGRDLPGPQVPPFWKKYVQIVSRAVSEQIFISRYCQTALYGSPSSQGRVIPFGVNTERFKPVHDADLIKKKFAIPPEKKLLFALQRLDHLKRVDIIIDAMEMVVKETDSFLIIGGMGKQRNLLESLSAAKGLASRIKFAGYISAADLPFFYAMADLFVFHSTYETFGVALLEAMAAGKPIVSVNCTAIPELVEHERNGLLVEPLNSREFARAVLSLLADDKRMKDFSEQSRKKAVENFQWDKIASEYEMVFTQYSRVDSGERPT